MIHLLLYGFFFIYDDMYLLQWLGDSKKDVLQKK